MIRVLVAGSIAAVGIGLFAYEVSRKPKPKPTHTTRPVAARPSLVRISLSDDERRLLSGEVGKRCALPYRSGLAIGGSPDRLDLVILPTRRCAALRLTFTPEQGMTVARQNVVVK